MLKWLEKVLMPLAESIGKNKYLIAIRDGFLVSTPLLIVGSLFLLIANFPIPAWTNWLNSVAINGVTLADYFAKPADATFSIMAVFAVIGIGYSFAKQMKTSPIFGAAVSVMAWFLVMPYGVNGEVAVKGISEKVKVFLGGGVPLGWLGAKGIFIGILCAFSAVHIYCFAERKGWVIKMPAGVPPTVVESFAALIPAGLVMFVFFMINLIFGLFNTDVFSIVFKFLQLPLMKLGDTLGAMVTAYIFLHLFWFFGINGGSVVGAVYNPILQTLTAENLEFFKNGVSQGHIICQQFQDLFATFGGCGSTLSLLIAMILFCKSKRIKQLGKLALVPGIFGINEPIVFGLPIVLNPIMLIPFMIVPTFNIVVSYFAMKLGLVPICNGVNIPWTTPIVISGFLATNWAGALLQAILLVIGVFIYIPFIKMIDKQYLIEESQKTEEDDDDFLDDLSFDDL